MELGLQNNEVRIVPYNGEWRNEFERVKKEIQEQTKLDKNRIEHIGSTAIEGMAAKPIIDIVVGIDDLSELDPSIVQGLATIGFLRLRVERPWEIVFAKFTDETYQIKTHFIHLVEYERELWKNLIFFREYLKSNESGREDYSNLKEDYLNRKATGVNEYTDYKEAFVKKIYNKRINS